MQLVISFANCNAEACAPIVQRLRLPNLQKLLRRLRPRAMDRGEVSTFSPPHERALARVLGLPVRDGQIPWAAWHAHPAAGAWGFVSPCHWVMGQNEVTMSATALADFPEAESRALLSGMQSLFAEDGIELMYDQPHRWLARGALLEGMVSAALDRAAGRAVQDWLARGAGAPQWRRLQTEVQMLLYHDGVNDARQARAVAPVNSFWLSGTGALDPGTPEPTPGNAVTLANELREAALQEDWVAWARAWQVVDGTHCAALLQAIEACGGDARELAGCTLSLCGERNALTLEAVRPRFWNQFINIFGRQSPSDVLGQL